MVIFLDTYAIIEIYNGNPAYKKYTFTNKKIVTTVLNLIETHFVILKHKGKDEADLIYKIISEIVIPISEQIIKYANIMKLRMSQKRLSFADCIGYTLSRKINANFVTGDYQFKEMEGVEFIK